jgi:heterodisulfide reductase subunit C
MNSSCHEKVVRGNPLVSEVEELAHTRISECYQCGKCTAGCPAADRMELTPNQVIRLLQLEDPEPALRSNAIWVCVSCQTCSTRCPKSVDCAGVMDALRQLAIAQGKAPESARRTWLFLRAFLDNVRRNGRVHELDLVRRFKTSTFLRELNVPFLFKDAMLGPKMFRRGKLHLAARRARDRALVNRIFERCERREGEAGQ